MSFWRQRKIDQSNRKPAPPLSGWGALYNRLAEDWLSAPFFFLWAIPVSAAIQYSENQKVHDFFVNTYGEGIALKSIVTLFAISLAPVGLALLLRPAPDGNWAKLLRAPARTGRAMSMTTLAFMSGAIPVVWREYDFARMCDLLAIPVIEIIFMWLTLFALDSCVLQAKSWKSMKHNGLSTTLGWALTVVGLTAPAILYLQIESGSYFALTN